MPSKETRNSTFNTITGADWKREIARGQSTPNDISSQIRLMENEQFIAQFNRIQKEVNQTAHDKGWYESKLSGVLDSMSLRHDEIYKELQGIEDARRIALIHSELSEALEGLRAGNPPSDKIGDNGFSQVEEEFADAIIRMMDVSQERGWRIAEAIIAKKEYNKGRSHRHGGKAF